MARSAARRACILASAGLVISVIAGCSGSERHPAPEHCEVTAPTECPDPPPTYRDVAPIIAERCASCHSGTPGGPWPLNTYGRVTDWADSVQGELLACTMPPADSGVIMADGERELILTWLRCDFPR